MMPLSARDAGLASILIERGEKWVVGPTDTFYMSCHVYPGSDARHDVRHGLESTCFCKPSMDFAKSGVRIFAHNRVTGRSGTD